MIANQRRNNNFNLNNDFDFINSENVEEICMNTNFNSIRNYFNNNFYDYDSFELNEHDPHQLTIPLGFIKSLKYIPESCYNDRAILTYLVKRDLKNEFIKLMNLTKRVCYIGGL